MPARTRFVHLLAVATLAITVPVLAAVGPQYYVGRGATGLDAVLVAVVVVVAPAALLFTLGSAAGVVSVRARGWAHLAALGLLCAALVSGALATSGLPVGLHLALALAGAAAGVGLYSCSSLVRTGLTVLAPAALVVLVLYLLQPGMRQLLREGAAEPAAAAPARAAERPTPVVLVVLDEMSGLSVMDRHGRLDTRRYPNFGRLARHATWYPNATSGRSDTELAVPSVLTGRWAERDTLPIAAQHPRSVFTLLSRTHAMHASEPWSRVCPRRLCPQEGHRPRLHRVADLLRNVLLVVGHVTVPAADRVGIPRPRESGAPSRVQQVHEFTARLRPEPRPVLHVLHVLLPHKPWRYLPDGSPYPNAVARDRWLAGFGGWGEDPWPVAQNEQRYLLQVGFVDRLLGLMLDRLQRTRLFDDAMLVVVADHGVSFRAGDRRRDATPTNAQDILSVPLLVKLPGQRSGRVDPRLARTVDVVPTIAAVQRMRIPWRADGRSLLRPVRRRGVWIENGDGSRIDWDAATFERRAREAIRERIARFGDGRTPRRLWTFGPRRELVGRSVRAFPDGPPADAEAHVLSLPLLADHRPGEPGVVPARIAGTVDGLGPGHTVAVALNGRIAATTRTYDGDRGIEFSAMVDPERDLRVGRNELQLFLVGPTGELRPLAYDG